MMDFKQQLDVYLRARFTLIIIKTREESRVIKIIQQVCSDRQCPCSVWDAAEGFAKTQSSNNGGLRGQILDPLQVLENIEKETARTVFVLKDLHDYWNNGKLKRKLRNVAQKLKISYKSVIITTPCGKIPPELEDEAVIINFSLPTAEELEQVLDELTKTRGLKVTLTDLGREKMVQAAMGMTLNQAQRAFAKAIVQNSRLDDRDITLITEEKKQIVRESESLEFYSSTETPDQVGGLGILKKWLQLRERAFTKEARDYGLPSPKGIALIGIPGTGKSLTAKMIAGLWQLPLLRLDVGSLFGSLVGESEERTRRALELAGLIAPCVFWIDEIEKAFSTSHGDAGTSQRVFASFLTWMQDKTAPCFVVATANNISELPPELLRRGRFDEVFFLDLPTNEERKEIFSIHLKRRKRLPQHFDLHKLANESNGYVGSEIEQGIIDAMYLAFNENMREITTDDLCKCLKRQIPLSVSQREIINGLRDWLREGRAQSASFADAKEAEQSFAGIPLELDPED